MPVGPLPLLAVPLLLAVAALAFTRPGTRPGALPRLAEAAALAAFGLAAAGVVQVVISGPLVLTRGSGLATITVRLDTVGATMAALVAFVGWVVVRYTRRYLDGEAREGAFHGLMLAALAAVLLLVQAGSLALMLAAFVAVGVVLRQLLIFYPERPEARRAAAKFALVWHGGDVLLAFAAGLFWLAYGTTDLGALARAAASSVPLAAQVAIALVVLAAALKTAAFPLHGWLTEVMEAPTPVSALLHAGIINAGGFILIRFADVMVAAPGVLAVAALLGGFSALCAAAIALTQPSIKGTLVWSTCAQMGFMVLQCGLALFPLALLHIVAHSLYKSHAFLSSGGAVQTVISIRRPGPVAVPDVAAVTRAFGLSVLVFVGVGSLFGLFQKPPQEAALGAILIFGVAYLMAQGLADLAPRALTLRTLLMSLAATLSYFTLQHLMKAASAGTLPAPPSPDGLMWATILLALASFGLAAFAQATFAMWARHPAVTGMRVHLLNGLYINALTDRLTGRWQPRKG